MTTSYLASARSGDLEGTYAGAVTRFVSFAIDLFAIGLLFSLGGLVAEYVLSVLLREPVRFAESSVAARVALVVWAFVYWRTRWPPPVARSAWRSSGCGRCVPTAAISTGGTPSCGCSRSR